MNRQLILLPALLAAVSTSAGAQSVTGNLEGTITAGPAPAAEAQVTVRGPALQGERTTLTDAQGRFRVLALPPGRYDVTVRHVGYRPLVLRDVTVPLGRTTALESVNLEARAVELAPIVVTAERAQIDPTTASLGAGLTSTALADLPIGRDYLASVSLLPHANQSYYGDDVNIAGRTGLENAVFLDGVNVTEPYKGAGGLALPFNFIEAIELRTGGYEAEYGRALGGIVNVITRSGGNRFEGSAFGFYTGSALANRGQRGFLDLGTGDFARYDVGASAGGPIVHDRLWYFAAYDAAFAQEDLTVPAIGVRTDRTRTHQFAGKLTWNAVPHTTFTMSLIGDPSRRDLVGNYFWSAVFPPDSLANPDPFFGRQSRGGWAVSLNARRIVRRNTLLEGTLSRYTTTIRDAPATIRGGTEALVMDFDTSGVIWSGGYGSYLDHRSTRVGASLALTHHVGDHSLKAGLQYEDNLLDETWLWLANGPRNTAVVYGAVPEAYNALVLDFQTKVHNRVASAFVQGSLRVLPWLRVNPGLRWDGQYLASATSSLSGSIADQWQPRLGLIVYPGPRENQKLTASYARYYEQLSNLPASFAYGGLHQDLYFYSTDTAGNQAEAHIAWDTRAASRLKGQYYDEFTVGYERSARRWNLASRIIYRSLRRIIATTFVTPDTFLTGNAGLGRLSVLPPAGGEYLALEFSAVTADRANPRFGASYVLSRNRGNYVGLYDQDGGASNPHYGLNYISATGVENAYGLLPNDRKHVAKLHGSYRFPFRLTAGLSFAWQSGTPLNEFGAPPPTVFEDVVFLRPRGTAGRTPSIWNLNVHLSYDLLPAREGGVTTRLRLDATNLFNQRQPVYLDQKRYLAADADGNQLVPNPNYRRPLAFQPPFTVRLGLETAW